MCGTVNISRQLCSPKQIWILIQSVLWSSDTSFVSGPSNTLLSSGTRRLDALIYATYAFNLDRSASFINIRY